MPSNAADAADLLLRRSSSLGEVDDENHFHNELQNGEKMPTTPPSFSIGVIADIQYAPIPDGFSYSGNQRYYRHALAVAEHAAMRFESNNVSLVLNLGDIVDGKCQDIVQHGGDPLPEGVDPGVRAVEDVLEALSHYKAGPILHAYGNHCLYNMNRTTLQQKLGMVFREESDGELVGYSSFLAGKVRFVTVDSYDVTKAQRQTDSAKHQEAASILRENNPNYETNENGPEGMEGVKKRFVAFNGGVGQLQLDWLRQTLQQAREAGERVLVLSHQPIHPDSTNPVCLMWNYDQVLDIMRDYSDIVMASLSGHAHKGGYARDDASGIHFRVVEAALESPPPLKAYAIVDVHDDCLVLKGFGNCQSGVYRLDHLKRSTGATVALAINGAKEQHPETAKASER